MTAARDNDPEPRVRGTAAAPTIDDRWLAITELIALACHAPDGQLEGLVARGGSEGDPEGGWAFELQISGATTTTVSGDIFAHRQHGLRLGLRARLTGRPVRALWRVPVTAVGYRDQRASASAPPPVTDFTRSRVALPHCQELSYGYTAG